MKSTPRNVVFGSLNVLVLIIQQIHDYVFANLNFIHEFMYCRFASPENVAALRHFHLRILISHLHIQVLKQWNCSMRELVSTDLFRTNTYTYNLASQFCQTTKFYLFRSVKHFCWRMFDEKVIPYFVFLGGGDLFVHCYDGHQKENTASKG